MKARGLYLHFPFCARKCSYCDFPSFPGKERYMAPYLGALLKEIGGYNKEKGEKYRISTIFMGGGTPTLFNGDHLAGALDKCRECFNVDEDAEITIESNPGTVDHKKLLVLRKSGFNRLSIGLQAWQDRLLKFLGRIHTAREFEDAVLMAQKAGFENINADVIFGIPGQSLEDWLETLKRTAALNVTHISAYSLIVEEGTPLYKLKQKGLPGEVAEDAEREMYHKGVDLLERLGFYRYEISNFARPGYECRHNLNYWKNGEYIGCGSGAHQYLDGVRSYNTPDLEAYIEMMSKTGNASLGSEKIDRDQEVFETLMLGFRLTEGIGKDDFHKRFGFDLSERYSDRISALKREGLVLEDDTAIRPTARGFDFQNQIALTFLD
ncbi:MAG TPA: radical SAM family heme chaperone HemW [Candidatus Atribacteria bacterium]|nr:radical SAM family heme chaperone HemW [Candidatus Atribacteria bacterium]HPT78873.1 radical SAM family heme chaperone HemW [Candidatus Atribacteria bacterium]